MMAQTRLQLRMSPVPKYAAKAACCTAAAVHAADTGHLEPLEASHAASQFAAAIVAAVYSEQALQSAGLVTERGSRGFWLPAWGLYMSPMAVQ
jgi:hypothetical protein